MAKEPDETKWVGIRPTDPSENIPVTESAPLSSIEVEPKAGSANFPVTESAPLSSIEVEPKAGSANLPIVINAVGLALPCAHSPGAADFKVATEKRTPAIGDLQAIHSLIRVAEKVDNVGAGNYDHDIYTVPADYMFMLEFIYAYCWQADPTFCGFTLLSGGVDYLYVNIAYGGAFTYIRDTNKILFDEGETVRIHWTATLATTDVSGAIFGYLMKKY